MLTNRQLHTRRPAMCRTVTPFLPASPCLHAFPLSSRLVSARLGCASRVFFIVIWLVRGPIH